MKTEPPIFILHFSLQVGLLKCCRKTNVTARAGTARGTSDIITLMAVLLAPTSHACVIPVPQKIS